ncbi:AbrB/MazE/SpoVT family DNA-binding domain-containing protein [Candidatus Pacearchaeota archaeon]|nr:AbrB/MazE/SpoVT family DNA-binding domain-containing protein [Candidatus Pacearchaeota archaeon]
MVKTEVITRKWGNSIGVILPKEIIEKENIKENMRIDILISKNSNVLNETFGMLKGKLKKSSQQMKEELKEELYPENGNLLL